MLRGRGDDVEQMIMNLAGLARAPSRLVKPPRVKGVPAALECKLVQIVQLKTHLGEPMDTHLVLGHVVGVHIDDAFITPEGRFDMVKARPIARCGYADYAVVDGVFALERPTRA